MSERTVLRLGSWAAIAGAAVALVANVLHPRMATFDDPAAEEMRIAAESDVWLPVHVAILIATLLIGFGLFALARSMKGGSGEAAARIALGSLLVSLPVAVVGVSIDGYAVKAIADAAAGDGAAATSGVAAVAHVSWATFMAIVITFAGVTPALFGAAVVADRGYPAWLGWTAMALGVVAAIDGLYGLLAGASAAFFVVFTVTSGILTLWLVAVGVLLARRAHEAVIVPEASARLNARA